MEKEIQIQFPGSSLENSAFYSGSVYNESFDYDETLDREADQILEQFESYYDSDMYQEGVIDAIATFGVLSFIGGIRLLLNPSSWPEIIMSFGSEWAPLAAGVSAVAIGGYIAAFKGISHVVRVCKAGEYVHRNLCEIADMISDKDSKIDPKKVVKVFKKLKKNLKALNSRFHKFTPSERKAISDLIDSTNNLIKITKEDVLRTELLKKTINDFLQDAKKVDDIIANPSTEQEMVSTK